jgi:hypothetical protein
MSNPSKDHFKALDNIWGYLVNTTKLGIYYKTDQSSSIDLIGYTDSDWGGDLVTRKSTSGYIFLLGSKESSNIISWLSKQQKVPAISSCEAEYMAYKEVTKENLFINSFIKEISLNKDINNSKIIYSDSQSAIDLSKNPIYHARTKHVDITYHFIRNYIVEGTIDLLYTSTNNMLADAFTKVITSTKWASFLQSIGIKECDF